MEKTKHIGLKKSCSYLNCTNNSSENPNLTFFAFPKDAERRQLWIQHSGASADGEDSKVVRFLCESHFSNIYLCQSQRRTLLLQTAVPYPCYKSVDGIEAIVPDSANEEGEHPEQTIETVAVVDESPEEEDIIKEENSSVDGTKPIELRPVKLSSLTSVRKRKDPVAKITEMKAKLLKRVLTVPGSSQAQYKIVLPGGSDAVEPQPVHERILQQQQQHSVANRAFDHQPTIILKKVPKPIQKFPATSSTKLVNIKVGGTQTKGRSDDMPDANREQISEFIFKGEEYVQMPKVVYYGQIERLKQKVANYETVINAMREILDHSNVDEPRDG